MEREVPPDAHLLDIGDGLSIGLRGQSIWQVWARHGCFDLIAPTDFYRVLVLLQRPYDEIGSLLNDYANKQGATELFPLWAIAWAGLSQSDEWASLALKWIPSMHEMDKVRLVDALIGVRQAKWASQKSRQLADRYIKQIQVPHKVSKK